MKVLYVSSVADDEPLRAALSALDSAFDLHVAVGAAAALVAVRTDPAFQLVVLSPQLPGNEALALIATLRRDRASVAIIALATEDQPQFFAPAMTAGADDVLIVRGTEFLGAADTLKRVRRSRHLGRPNGEQPLLTVFAGQDDLAWDLVLDMAFVTSERATITVNGEISSPLTVSGEPADLVIVDDHVGDAHPLQVVKWLKTHYPALPVVVLTSPSGSDVGGAALDLGADDVVSKSGTYRRRLMATLHRYYVAKNRPGSSVPVVPDVPVVPVVPANESDQIAHMRAVIHYEARIRDLASQVQSLSGELTQRQRAYDELREAQAFERAMRDRDREELTSVRQALSDERDRRIVLEGTLRHTEDRSRAALSELESRQAAARRQLEDQLAAAADRLHQVASETQALQTRLQNELATQEAERERLTQSRLFGYAVLTQAGVLLDCNETFARMFGFDSPADVPRSEPFSGLADHAHVVRQLREGAAVERVESVVRRANGSAMHVLTSAALVSGGGEAEPVVERIVIDLDAKTQAEDHLRLARRLEMAGRLAAEMSGEIEPLLAAFEDPSEAAEARRRAALLVRQLLAFSRRQARPAGFLSLSDAIRRAEPLLRQIGGEAVSLEFDLEDVGAIAAGEEDIEQLLGSLMFAAAGSLPFGGAISIRTRSVRSGFGQHTELTLVAAGYGVHTALLSTSLVRLVSRCGGTIRITDEPARTTTLHVHLPS
ncbi:MAG TPA: PAS domain S-box protein [Vicinamibacterales bacterium]|nr:PAS domain S-box protein [Vicinamibacterales bacterium]